MTSAWMQILHFSIKNFEIDENVCRGLAELKIFARLAMLDPVDKSQKLQQDCYRKQYRPQSMTQQVNAASYEAALLTAAQRGLIAVMLQVFEDSQVRWQDTQDARSAKQDVNFIEQKIQRLHQNLHRHASFTHVAGELRFGFTQKLEYSELRY